MRISDWSSDVCSSDLGFIAKKAAEGGLGDVSLAKAICLPETRLDAACLAWDIARTRGIASSEIPQLDNIAKEMVVMENEGEAGSTVRLARLARAIQRGPRHGRSEEHTSELQSLIRLSYAVF